MHISLHVCVCVHICISTNKQKKNSQVLCFIKRTYNLPQRYISTPRDGKKTTTTKKKNMNMGVSVSSGKHLST